MILISMISKLSIDLKYFLMERPVKRKNIIKIVKEFLFQGNGQKKINEEGGVVKTISGGDQRRESESDDLSWK